jgi:hypothetical protein
MVTEVDKETSRDLRLRASNKMMSRRDEVKIAQRFNAALRVVKG